MVRQAALREVIGADALAAVARADQALARGRFLRLLLAQLHVLDARGQHFHRLRLVLVLAAVILAFHHDAGRQVGDAHGRIGLVDVLSARARGAVGVDAQVGRVDVDVFHFIGFRHHRHRAGGRVDAALRFRGRHALHAVAARLEFQLGICAIADDTHDHFAVAAQVGVGRRHQLDLPAVALGKARVHA